MRLGGGTKSNPELLPSFLRSRPLALQEGSRLETELRRSVNQAQASAGEKL